MTKRRATTDGDPRPGEKQKRRARNLSRFRLGTALGSAVGVAVVLSTAAALGAGVLGFATSVAVGVVLGGWAGDGVSRRGARAGTPREAVKRRRSDRILRITRTLRRRRRLVTASGGRALRTFPRLVLVKAADPIEATKS